MPPDDDVAVIFGKRLECLGKQGGLLPAGDEAFQQLRLQSQHENIKLRAIAEEIVMRAQRSEHYPCAGSAHAAKPQAAEHADGR